MQNELCRLTRRPSRDCYVTALAVLVGLLLSASAGLAQQTSPPPAQGSAVVPTFEALPHSALPPGEFVTWCGQNGRYLLNVKGWANDQYRRENRIGIVAYQAGVKPSTPFMIPASSVQCGRDGREFVFVDINKRQLTKVDIETGKSVLLATLLTDKTPKISFSPDLQSVATNMPLWLLPAAGMMKIIPVKESASEEVRQITWSLDGSRVMVSYFTSIDILDADGHRVGGGLLPKDSWVQDVWFDGDLQTLTLLVSNPIDESEPGPMIKCNIANWKCDAIRSRIDSASVGGRGLRGMIGPLDKPDPTEGGDRIYSRYAAELMGDASKPLVRQVFQTALGGLQGGHWSRGRAFFKIYVAPSGQQVVLTWSDYGSPPCQSPIGERGCPRGLMIDLSGVK